MIQHGVSSSVSITLHKSQTETESIENTKNLENSPCVYKSHDNVFKIWLFCIFVEMYSTGNDAAGAYCINPKRLI